MTTKCYYDNDRCGGDLWQCATCKQAYCRGHSHGTALGTNVECVACERERKDAAARSAEPRLGHIDKLVDGLDVRDKK